MQDASQIRERMEVVGSDGGHVGTVDKVEGDRIKLTKKDDPDGSGGHHHHLPLSAVSAVAEGRVELSMPAEQAKRAATGGSGDAAGGVALGQGTGGLDMGSGARARVSGAGSAVAGNPGASGGLGDLGMRDGVADLGPDAGAAGMTGTSGDRAPGTIGGTGGGTGSTTGGRGTGG